MNTTSWDERQAKRLKELMLVNPRICLDRHQQDLKVCKEYLSNENTKDFEEMLVCALKKVENYLSYNRKHLGIENDYLDILGDVGLIAIKKLSTFRGGSLFSTWVKGIMRYELLKYYSKKHNKNEVKLSENIINENQIEKFEDQEKLKKYFLGLSKQETFIINAIVFNGHTTESLADKIKRPTELLNKIYLDGLSKIKNNIKLGMIL